MKDLGEYKREHSELSGLVTVLRGLLINDQRTMEANAHLAHEKLRSLAEKVQAHLQHEDKELYPSLLVNEDPEIKTIAWGFISGESHLRKEFGRYCKRWLKTPDLQYSDDFLEDTNEMLDALMKRIEIEETRLFPKLQEANRQLFDSNKQINLVDVTVHIDEELDRNQRQALIAKVREENGVVSVSLHDNKPHLMIVEYNPEQCNSGGILERIKREGIHAELIGL